MGNAAPCCSSSDEKTQDVFPTSALSKSLAHEEELVASPAVHVLEGKLDGEEKKVVQVTDKTYPEGGSYTGDTLNGLRDGTGVYIQNGSRYEGSWLEDKEHGFGKQAWNDGRTYEGQYTHGRFCGKGKMTWTTPDGPLIYDGEYQDDQKHGHGKFKWPDGRCYEGSWQHGKRHGEANYTSLSGETRRGEWINDKHVRWIQ